MIKNYLKLAWRNLVKHKSISLLNLTGLSIGIASCLVIFTYVFDELTYDQYNPGADRIGRIVATFKTPEADLPFATSPYPLASTLMRDYPELASATRLQPTSATIKSSGDLFKEEGFYHADKTLFTIFPFTFIEGTAASSLSSPDAIVLTEPLAKKYFGTAPALGKSLIVNGKSLAVTGVVRERPHNSDIPVRALVYRDFSTITSWTGDDFESYTFVLFKQQPNWKQFEQKIQALPTKYIQPELNQAGADKYHVIFEVEPLKTVHFTQGKLADTPKGNRQFNYIFSLLATFILIIALLNYINLSTAKATERAKEVGIRKVSGAGRGQLVRQFLFESFVMISLAWLLAFGLAYAAFPFFNKLLNVDLRMHWNAGGWIMLGIFVLTVILAGLYPAMVLSQFKPAIVLKGSWRHSLKGIFLRKAVTFTQFAIAAALIMGTTVIYQQMQFVRKQNLGFAKDQVLNIYTPTDSVTQGAVQTFYNELKQRAAIKDFTAGSGIKAEGVSMASTVVENGEKKREFVCNYYFIDTRFLSMLQIPLVAGRNLSDSLSTDKTQGIIVNEAFVRSMGWTNALGKKVEGFGKSGPVIGVVRDFYYKSLHNAVEPLVLIYNTFPLSAIMVKTDAGQLPMIRELWKKNLAGLPFEYSFMDEMVEKQYSQDKITMSLFNDFTALAILVSCLGLYGLVSLVAIQRTREIGIRKVLGASLAQLFGLLSRDFLRLVFLSLVIALPLAAYFMNKWLSGYAYHVDITWWFFGVPLLLLPAIALLVISREVLRASLANPTQSLKMD